MSNDLKKLVALVEAEAEKEGPEAVAELHSLRASLALGRQIRQLRRDRKLSQDQLAELTGIDQSEISKIERGVSNPTRETLQMLGEPFAVQLRYVDPAGHVVGEPELALA